MIYVECKPDYTLVKYLAGFIGNQVHHSPNKSKVINNLAKNPNSLGLIDEDSSSRHQNNDPVFLKNMKVIDKKYQIIIRNSSNGSHAIALDPRLEDWFVNLSRKYRVSLSDFGLPDRANQLHKLINRRLDNFRKLIDELKDKEELLYLRDMILKYNQ